MSKLPTDIHISDAIDQLNTLYSEIAVFNVTQDTYYILRSANKAAEHTVIKWSAGTKELLHSGALLEADHPRWIPYAQPEFWEKDPFANTNCIITAVRMLKDGVYRWMLIEFSPTRAYSPDNIEVFFMLRDIHEWFAPLYEYRQSMEHAIQTDYSSVYHVDLDADTFEIKHFSNSLRDSVRTSTQTHKLSYSSAISQYVTENVVLSEQDYILRVLSSAYILEKFKKHNDFVVNYRVKPNPEGQEYFELHVIKVSENSSRNKAFVAFRCIDDTMNETIRKEQVLWEAKEAAKEKQEMLESLADIYVSLHYINLQDFTYTEIEANDYIHDLLGTEGDLRKAFELKSQFLTDPNYKDTLLDFVNVDTLKDRLRDKKIISREFLGTMAGWCRANFIPVKRDENGDVTHTLYLVQPIDEEKTKELNYQLQLKEALDNTNAIFREVLEMQSCGIVAYAPEIYKTIAFNRMALDIYDMPEFVDSPELRDILLERSLLHPGVEPSEETLDLIYRLDHILETKEVITYEMSVPHADGTTWDILAQAKVIELEGGLKVVTHSLTNITETKQLERKLRYLSEIDALTGIKNRGYGEQTISSKLEGKEPGMFCLFDIDNFKQINDRFGHAVGDHVLIEVAKCLTETFDEQDVVMRLGGDEFAIYSTIYTQKESATKLLTKLQNSISKITYHDDAPNPVSISMGVVFSDASISDFDLIYHKADATMYQAKQNGKGNLYFYE